MTSAFKKIPPSPPLPKSPPPPPFGKGGDGGISLGVPAVQRTSFRLNW